MKEVFDLVKVVDPHKHMPTEIKDALLESRRGEQSNDSCIHWTVGESGGLEYDPSKDPVEELDDYGDITWEYRAQLAAKVDHWLLQHFGKFENILVLFWW